MSQKIVGMVWGLDLQPAEMNVLHAYADHADHNGENVRPSLDLIAWKTNLSERYVQKITHRLRELAYLIPVRYEQGGRGHVTEYRIDFTNASWTPFPRPRASKGTKPAPDEGTITDGTEDTLTEVSHTVMHSAGEPQDTLSIKGEPQDTLSIKGEPQDTLSMRQSVRKGVLKGELQDTPILEPKEEREDPSPTSPGEGRDFSLSLGQGNNTTPAPVSPVQDPAQCDLNLDGVRGLMASLAREDPAPPPDPARPPAAFTPDPQWPAFCLRCGARKAEHDSGGQCAAAPPGAAVPGPAPPGACGGGPAP